MLNNVIIISIVTVLLFSIYHVKDLSDQLKIDTNNGMIKNQHRRNKSFDLEF